MLWLVYSKHRQSTLVYGAETILGSAVGYNGRMTGHGFSSVASTYLNNLGTIRPDMIKAQLAHGDKDRVCAAYNRADYMEYRKAMM